MMEFLIFLYLCAGVIVLIGYIPTTKDLFKGKNIANLGSYIVWSLTSIISFLYDIFVVDDILVTLKDGVHVFFCILIVVLIYRNKATTNG